MEKCVKNCAPSATNPVSPPLSRTEKIFHDFLANRIELQNLYHNLKNVNDEFLGKEPNTSDDRKEIEASCLLEQFEKIAIETKDIIGEISYQIERYRNVISNGGNS